jgi:hypothetical protein
MAHSTLHPFGYFRKKSLMLKKIGVKTNHIPTIFAFTMVYFEPNKWHTGLANVLNCEIFTCVASQHVILCDITTTAAAAATTPRFLKCQNSQPNLL